MNSLRVTTSTQSNEGVQGSSALAAAEKLITNHEAVVADCCAWDEPISQKHLPRASDQDTADVLLRLVASILLEAATASKLSVLELAATATTSGAMAFKGESERTQGALALKTVATRLCVPRDMGAPSAALLRGVLNTVAERVLASVGTKEEDRVATKPVS